MTGVIDYHHCTGWCRFWCALGWHRFNELGIRCVCCHRFSHRRERKRARMAKRSERRTLR